MVAIEQIHVLPDPPSGTQILNGEELISLAAAGKLLPGHRTNTYTDGATIWRWVVRGAKSTTGELVRLEAVRAGGRWLTSAEAVRRFVANLTAASISNAGTPAASA